MARRASRNFSAGGYISHWLGGPHPTLSQSGGGGIGMSDQELFSQKGSGLVWFPEIIRQAMSCKWSKGTSGPAGDEHHNLICTLRAASPHANSEAQGIHTISQYGNIAGTLMKRHDSSPCADRGMTVIGFHGSQSPDSSEEREESVGLNHEQEICIAIHPHCIGRSPSAGPQGKEYLTDGSAYTMDTKGTQAIAIRTAQTSSNGNGISEELAHTLDSANGLAVAFAQNQLGEVRIGNICGTLNRNSNASGRSAPLLFTPNSTEDHPPVQQRAGSSVSFGVRRLTPRECERLQGFPDDYTAISWRGRPAEECPDGPRYKALGNSMAVPVMRWLGKRIEKYGSPA